MRDLRLGDGAALLHFVGHGDKKVEGGGAGLFVDFFRRDDDFGEDGGDKMEFRGWKMLDYDGDGVEAVTAGGARGGRCGVEEEGLEFGVAFLEGENAGWGGRKTWE